MTTFIPSFSSLNPRFFQKSCLAVLMYALSIVFITPNIALSSETKISAVKEYELTVGDPVSMERLTNIEKNNPQLSDDIKEIRKKMAEMNTGEKILVTLDTSNNSISWK